MLRVNEALGRLFILSRQNKSMVVSINKLKRERTVLQLARESGLSANAPISWIDSF